MWLGTTLIGGLYIPGRSSVPKDTEYLPAVISRSCCSHTKHAAASSRVHVEKSNVSRSFGLITAIGQAPSLSEQHTDSTSSQFGCCRRSDSNLLILIGITILNRSGRSLRVQFASTLDSSEAGIEGKGGAVSVDEAKGVLEGVPQDQRNPLVQRGHFHLSSSLFCGFLMSR